MADQDERARTGSTTDVDRRRAGRRPAENPVRVRTSAELDGNVRDRSEGGLFLELEGDLVLEVEVHESGGAVMRRARLLRSQRLAGGRMGWAVEFIEPA